MLNNISKGGSVMIKLNDDLNTNFPVKIFQYHLIYRPSLTDVIYCFKIKF